MNPPIITLTCDFGDRFAVGQLESVINTINPRAKFLLASKEVSPFSIVEGAFIIEKFIQFTAPNSIHIGVIDPGVGSDRIGIVVKTKNHYFVGPNNGLFYPAASKDGIEKVYKINEEKIGSLSNTFHGRDIFAKAAAYLTTDKLKEDYLDEIAEERFIKLEYKPNQVVHIDPYGNIKLNNPADYLPGDILEIEINGTTYEVPFVKTFADVPQGAPLTYWGSHQVLELALNLDNAAQKLNIKVEDVLSIKKLDAIEIKEKKDQSTPYLTS
jgi:S-adenosylmethionine hydrolase